MVFLPCGHRNIVHVKYEPCNEEKFITPAAERTVEYGPLIAASIITTPLLIVSFAWLTRNSIRDADMLIEILLSLTAIMVAVDAILGMFTAMASTAVSGTVEICAENVSSSEDSGHLSCWLNRMDIEEDEEEHLEHSQHRTLDV